MFSNMSYIMVNAAAGVRDEMILRVDVYVCVCVKKNV